MDFFEKAAKEISSHVNNDHRDNWDYLRFGKRKSGSKNILKAYLQKLIKHRGYYHMTAIHVLLSNSFQIHYFEYLYDNLNNEDDRKLLLQVIAYRILGYTKVKLPLNTPEYWSKIREIENLTDKSDYIDPKFLDIFLYKFNLEKLNYPIKIYFSTIGIMIDFIVKQYEYNKGGTVIKADKGDIVIDGGGCWGDTALFFANEVGPDGKVFSFEFIPNNISIFEKNIAMNEKLKENIELVRNPLWKDSVTKVYYKDDGPASNVGLEAFNGQDGECYTMNIDELVKQKSIDKIDFIKMDIEGAELNALRGATETIKKYKPKLAIALYHSTEEFESIPSFIKTIVPEYKLYFSHCTIFGEESILFAKVD